jgi:hypothetical protein
VLRSLIGISVAALLLPPFALAQKVSYDQSPTANFSEIRTYTFKHNTTEDPLVDQRYAAAISAELEARGLRRDDRNPDAIVSARQTFHTRQEITMYNSGYYGPYGYGWGYAGWYGAGWGGGYTDVEVKDIQVRTLTVDVSNAKDKQLLWRGIGVRDMKRTKNPERVTKRVNEEVTKIFKHFPPMGYGVALTEFSEPR